MKNQKKKKVKINKFGLSKRTLVFLLILLLAIGGLLFGVIKLYGRTVVALDELDSAFNMLSDAKQKMEESNVELYEKRLEDAFTHEQLIAIAQQFVKYELYVNNRKIEENQSIFYSQTPKIMITFYERFERDTLKVLPVSVMRKTSKVIEDVLKKNILVNVTESDYTIEERLTPEGIRTDLFFTGVKSGEIITLDMDYKFSELIGLSDSSLEIFYNIAMGEN